MNTNYPVNDPPHGKQEDQISWSPVYGDDRSWQHGTYPCSAIMLGCAIAIAIWTAIGWIVSLFLK